MHIYRQKQEIFFLSLHYVILILLDSKIPKVSIFFIEIPYAHGIIVIYQLISSSSFHVVYLRFKVVRLIRFIHLNNAKYDCKYACSNEQILPLKHTLYFGLRSITSSSMYQLISRLSISSLMSINI